MSDQPPQDAFNLSLRKFLKQFGVSAQRELERVAAAARARGNDGLVVRAVLTAEGTALEHVVEARLDLTGE